MGDMAALMVRPEFISISANNAKPSTDFDIKAKVKNRIFLGEHTEYLVDAAGFGEILVLTPKRKRLAAQAFYRETMW
jgi:spermidine/putrescine transport system ATP-binding protein